MFEACVSSNVFLTEIEKNLPRVLSLFDADRTSASFGAGDRYYWAWGLIDFSNGTFQGACHGLARLYVAGLWPSQFSKEVLFDRIDSMFEATLQVIRPDGSLEEAFPNEGSYCVTALVAFDLLCTVDLLADEVSEETRDRWLKIVKPLVGFVVKSTETHAFISNHLATAAAALFRWHALTNDKNIEAEARSVLDSILSNQSSEGWFKEYEGADPGYQTLCTYYLADIHQLRPDLNLGESLRRSIQFLWYFAHPDGSFGGLYGSRCTRFYFPAGISALSNEIPEAAALNKFMMKSIAKQRTVTLSAIDEPNLIPMFNAYAWAAERFEDTIETVKPPPREIVVPCQSQDSFRRNFKDAGIIIDRQANCYTVISTHKGGVIYNFRNEKLCLLDSGVVVRDRRGTLGSTQVYDHKNECKIDGNRLELYSTVAKMPKQLPSPFKFLVLRFLCISVFRIPLLRELVKQQLVKLLITKRSSWPVKNKRIITLGKKTEVKDQTELPSGYHLVSDVAPFVSIHMASQGYWQIQDELIDANRRAHDSSL